MALEATWNPNLWMAAGGTLPHGWQLHPFEDFLESPKSIAVGVMYPGNHSDDGIPLIRVGDVQDGGVVAKPAMRISGEVHYEYRRTALAGNELLITLVGNPGVCVIAQPSMKGWNVARALAVAKLKSPKLRAYLKAVLESSVMKSIISGMLNTTVQPTLNLKEIKSLPIPMPDRLDIADAIGDFSELFSRRVDLLRQANATLEFIAQALFKSWFIDFDPVRAKAEGREPVGMDAETAALFPDSFEKSALGEIPKGWSTGSLKDAFDLNPVRSLAKGADAPYLEMANAPTAGHRPQEIVRTRPFGSGCKFRNGDALLAKITPCLENGKSAFIDFLGENAVGWGSTEFIVLRSRSRFPDFCAYLLARHEPFRQFAIQAMTGTSGRQRVDLSRLAQFALAIPPDEKIATSATAIFDNIRSRIAANDEQVQTLAAMRNTLLPRLISGKLRLPEAAAQLKEALA
ncbi:hypothetical protein BJG93_00760 [Paraburkholderia sprentiae WSM5005]|uniref:Type I restriction modification DNA specificity domain-containing protein n=1 Tax=Paraburkholderia sprentiae WSM5005 TaxID=754502 RepID=A0A1I9YKI6_9BURK|nr:hypothetical protein [Paraburkholderia sprentiae]APA86819.2 hypothetical protein BJG93_00760 [Paraburkholderia sprentiae WSM5005]